MSLTPLPPLAAVTPCQMVWRLSHRADREALPIADRRRLPIIDGLQSSICTNVNTAETILPGCECADSVVEHAQIGVPETNCAVEQLRQLIAFGLRSLREKSAGSGTDLVYRTDTGTSLQQKMARVFWPTGLPTFAPSVRFHQDTKSTTHAVIATALIQSTSLHLEARPIVAHIQNQKPIANAATNIGHQQSTSLLTGVATAAFVAPCAKKGKGSMPNFWRLSHRAEPAANEVAKRHYNCQTPDSKQFVPPGRCIVLASGSPVTALWVSSWPFAEYVKHDWPGAWINSCFRKECDGEASDFIRQAVAATRWYWPNVPTLGMVTFIDPVEVKPRVIRGRQTWGHSYFKAGFKHVGYTKAGLWTFQMLPDEMPEACAPINAQGILNFAEASP